MRKFSIFLMTCILLAMTGCNKGGKINGHTIGTAYRSVKMLKDRLPVEQRIEFELSFWTARDAIKDNDEFLDTVDGKTPQQIIELGKQLYAERKAAGFKGYDQFASWDEMIANYTRERSEQDRPKGRRVDPKDKANEVLYRL